MPCAIALPCPLPNRRPEAGAPGHPCGCSVPPPQQHVQTAHCRATPRCAPLRQAAAGRGDRGQRPARETAAGEAGGEGGVKSAFICPIRSRSPQRQPMARNWRSHCSGCSNRMGRMPNCAAASRFTGMSSMKIVSVAVSPCFSRRC